MKSENVLLTGATGAFGQYLLGELLASDCRITVLVRAESNVAAKQRIGDYVKDEHKLSRIKVLSADLEKVDFGLSSYEYKGLQQSVTAVLHAAASTRFNLSLADAYRCNVLTTNNMIEFACKAQNLTKFGYVSTAFTAGKRTGVIKEDVLDTSDGFVNTYDQTKFEAETQVRAAVQKIPVAIYRPSLIVARNSDSHHAAVAILNLIKKNMLPVIPGLPTDLVDLISATEASQAIIDLFSHHFVAGETFHIASGKQSPTLESIVAIAKDPDKTITYTGHDVVKYDQAVGRLITQQPALKPIYQKIDRFIKYLCYPKLFDTQNTETALGKVIGTDNVIAILAGRMADD